MENFIKKKKTQVKPLKFPHKKTACCTEKQAAQIKIFKSAA